jgi:energy-coupling factor transporter ATP-binding protein EcfA2
MDQTSSTTSDVASGGRCGGEEAVQALTAEQRARVAQLKAIYVEYDQTVAVTRRIRQLMAVGGLGNDASISLLTGESGVGKSTVIEAFAAANPPRRSAEGVERPVALQPLFTPCTVKAMVVGGLEALEVPCSDRSTLSSLHRLWVHHLREQDVRLIIADEVQHLLEPGRDRLIHQVADYLKTLLNETRIPILCVGLPSAEMILQENPQLERRSDMRVRLRPFVWRENGAHFRTFLHVLKTRLPFDEPPALEEQGFAHAMFEATDGYVGRVVRLTRQACIGCILRGSRTVTIADFAQAFEEIFDARAQRIVNPFRRRGRGAANAAPPDAPAPLPGPALSERRGPSREALKVADLLD